MEGTGVGDFENGSDVVLFNDLSKITGDAPVRVARNEKWTTSSGEKRILVKFPDIGGFVPLGAKRPDGSPHPYAGTGFSFCEALEFPMAEDGKFSWEAKSLPQVEVHQLAFDGRTFRVVKHRPAPPRPAPDDRRLRLAPGHARLDHCDPGRRRPPAGCPSQGPGDDRLRHCPLEAAVGHWQPVSFARVTVGCSEPTLIPDRDGMLLVTARTYGDDFNAVRVWRSGDAVHRGPPPSTFPKSASPFLSASTGPPTARRTSPPIRSVMGGGC